MISFVELHTSATFASIRVMNDMLDVALRGLAVGEPLRHDLALGLAELVANVCEHEGEGCSSAREVRVRLEVGPEELRLTVSSAGPRFDLEAALRRAAEHDPLAELDGHGLGLPLLVGLFDAVDHAYEELAGNRITLRKRRVA